MKKLLLLLTVFALGFALTACDDGEDVDNELPALPDEITMENVDEYIGRPDVQYVDLRNFDDKINQGYIAGFEMIPFFDYLHGEDVLVKMGAWEFEAAAIKDQAALERLFDDEKAILLMCAGGTRAGYVKEALESIGYDNVYNIGGFGAYAALDGAENLVLGDGMFVLDPLPKGAYTPGTYYGVDTLGGYMTTVVVNSEGAIVDVIFDAFSHGSTKQALGENYGMRTATDGWTWAEMAEVLADYVIANQGFGDMAFDETAFDAAWNALTVPHHIIENDVANSPDDVAGVTAGMEGFVFSWNLAIEQASDSDLGVIPTAVSYEQWVAAHEHPIMYNDGVFYGYYEGYSALVTVEGGFITDVYLDALHCRDNDDDTIKETCNTKRSYTFDVYPMNYVTNDNGTPLDETDDFLELPEGKLNWWGMADALGEAVEDAQTWDDAWTMTDEAHFDEGIDAVAGVTVSVDKWKMAVEAALDAAMGN